MSLGIIPELEFECLPRPGELIVAAVNHRDRLASTSEHIGGAITLTAPFDHFIDRFGRTCREMYPGDLVRVAPADGQVFCSQCDAAHAPPAHARAIS